MKLTTPIKVRYGETDMMGIVYHANYLLYFEDARTDFLERIGFPYAKIEEAGYMCPIRNVEISYGAPLHYGEGAFIETSVVKNAATKTVYVHSVFREGMDPEHDKPLATALITCCMVERETFKPVSIKRVVPELFALYNDILEPQEEK